MTKRECILQLREVNCYYYYVQDTFEKLYNITMKYDPKLAFMFDDFMSEDSALDYASSCTDFEELCNCVKGVDEFKGLYRLDPDGNLENVTYGVLYELRAWIIDTIERINPEPEEPTTEDNSDVVWVEEDDDFLTKRRTE